MTEALGKGVDYVFVNVQAFFGEVTIDEVSEWTHNYMENDQPSVVQEASNHPASFYGEVRLIVDPPARAVVLILPAVKVGWPSSALPNGSITLNGSIASVDNLQQYLDDFVCDSNKEGTQYFWFQSFDADWTAEVYGGPERKLFF